MTQDAVQSTPAKTIAFETPLTPREILLARVAAWLGWGAVANTVLMALLALVGTFAASQANAGLVRAVESLVAGRFASVTGYGQDTALLAGILLMAANTSALLVVMVGLTAQELWSALLLGLLALLNIIGLVLLGFFPALLLLIITGRAAYWLIQDVRVFRTNPVMLKELRERMRGARAFVVITVYLGLMSAFALLLYLIQRGVLQSQRTSVTGELGRVLFIGVVGVELLLIIFIAPALTAGAVTTERERKTYDLLQITLLPRASFIIGKLESALSYIFLLLLAAIPLQSIAFLFGGVSETEVALAFVVLAMTAVTLGAVGLYFSTVVDRTLTASIRAYTAAFSVVVGVPLLLSYFVGMFSNAVVGTGSGMTSSPTLEAALIYFGGFLTSLNPVLTSVATQQLLVDQQTLTFWTATLSSNGSAIPMISPWITFTIIYLAVSTVLVVLAVRRMRRAED